MNKFSLILVLSLVSGMAFSQVGGGYEITVIGEGEREINTPSKKSELPKIVEDSLVNPPKENYNIAPKTVQIDFEPDPIKPAKLKVSEPLEKLYRGYVKAGIGTYLMPYADLYYGSSRSRKNNWGINAKHFSSNQSLSDVGQSTFSENELHANYKHFLKDHSLLFNADYERNNAFFYGFDLNDTLVDDFYRTKDNIRSTYNYAHFNSTLESYYKDSAKLNHKVDLGFYHLAGNWDNRENNLLIDAHLQKYFGKELGMFDFELDYNNYKYKGLNYLDTNYVPQTNDINFASENSAILKLTPAIESLRKNLKARIGASIQVNTESGGVSFFPSAEVKYSLFNNMFVPYAGATGGMERNSLRSFSQENPFVMSQFRLKNTVERYKLYAGIRGSVSSTVSFNVHVSHARYTDMPLFFNDTVFSIGNRFGVLYDNANVFNVGGQLTYHQDERLKVYTRAEFRSYDLDNQAHAWFKPNLEVSVGAVYDLADKLIIKADVFYIGTRFYNELEDVTSSTLTYQKIKPVVDANLGVEYRYTDRLSAFINLNNLTTKKYQLWNRFPAQSINILGGITYRF